MPNKNIKKAALFSESKEKGVALLVTFFIMGIALSIVLGISGILISEVRMIRSMGNSVVAFYTADTGMEEVIYFDTKQIPAGEEEEEEEATRGFCNICNVCPEFGCEPSSCVLTPLADNGCDLITCQNCQVSYCSGEGCTGGSGKKYNIVSSVSPTEESFKSYGTYAKTTRAIELNFVIGEDGTAPQAPMITNTAVVPRAREFGLELEVVADIYDPDGVANAEIHIQYPDENEIDVRDFPLCTEPGCSGTTHKTTWTGDVGFYYVDITACDTEGHCSERENI